MAILFELRPYWHVSYNSVAMAGDEGHPLRQVNLGPIAVLWFSGSLVDLMARHESLVEEAAIEHIQRWQAAEAAGKQG